MTRLTQEEIEALDPKVREMYEQVVPLAEARGLDVDAPEFWQRFAENIGPIATQIKNHTAASKSFYERITRR